MPQYGKSYIFKAALLPGVKFPPPVLDEHDKRDIRIGYHGRNSYGRRGGRGGGRGGYDSNRPRDNREVAGRFIK